MIEIVINGEKKSIKKGLNLKEMLEFLNYEENSFAVAIDATFVPLKEYEKRVLKDGETIDILAPMVGG